MRSKKFIYNIRIFTNNEQVDFLIKIKDEDTYTLYWQ